MSAGELNDLITYVMAAATHNAPEDPKARKGRRVAAKLGCFGCHGPGGMGTTNNPGSFKGYIPPWDGADFTDLVVNDDELREWILDGSPRRLNDDFLASIFLARQIIKMPRYYGTIKRQELEAIIAYIHWLRRSRDQ